MPSFRAVLAELGYPAREITEPNDRVVDTLVAHGTPHSIAEKVHAHLAAGADHVTLLPSRPHRGRWPTAARRYICQRIRGVCPDRRGDHTSAGCRTTPKLLSGKDFRAHARSTGVGVSVAGWDCPEAGAVSIDRGTPEHRVRLLAVSHWIEHRTGWSIRKFVHPTAATAPSRSAQATELFLYQGLDSKRPIRLPLGPRSTKILSHPAAVRASR